MDKKYIAVPGRLESVATDGQIAGANQVYDDDMQKSQAEVNASSAYLGEDDGEGIKHLKDAEGNNINPTTSTKAVKDEQGNLLSDTLIEVNNKVDALQKQDVVPVDTLPAVADADPKKIYRVVGTDSYTDHMLNAAGDDFKILATYSFPGIDDEPTADSDNLVKSGGVFNELNKFKIKNKIEAYSTAPNYYIKDDYMSGYDTTKKLVKFKVIQNERLYIKAKNYGGVTFQFQEKEDVPSQRLPTIVGEPYKEDADGIFIVPPKANYLIISCIKASSYERVYRFSAHDKGNILSQVLSESYIVKSVIRVDGNVSSLSVELLNGAEFNIDIERDEIGNVNKMLVKDEENTSLFTIIINRDDTGNVISTNIKLN